MTTIAVLGTGIMGLPIAANLLDAGFSVRAWNRTPDRARPLADRGAVVAATPSEAVLGAQNVLTMLSGRPAVRAVMGGLGAALGGGRNPSPGRGRRIPRRSGVPARPVPAQ
jgi:3-hydroxyisobutyrate dehydrogenase